MRPLAYARARIYIRARIRSRARVHVRARKLYAVRAASRASRAAARTTYSLKTMPARAHPDARAGIQDSVDTIAGQKSPATRAASFYE